MNDQPELHSIARLIERKAAGEFGALDGSWADEVVLWHCWEPAGYESRRRMESQASSSREKHEVLTAGRANFKRQSTVHVAESTGRIIEESVWSAEGPDGIERSLFTCLIYTVVAGKITRMDIYDDESQSKAWTGEWPAHLREEEIEIKSA